MLRWKMSRLLLLVKAKVSNFIGKSLNLAPLLCRCHDAPAQLSLFRSKSSKLDESGLRNQFIFLSMKISDETNASYILQK